MAAEMKGEKAPQNQDNKSGGSQYPDNLFEENEPQDMYTFKVTYSESCAMPSARGMVLLRNLGRVAEVCRTIPEDLDADSADDEITKSGLYIKLITDDLKFVTETLSNGINVEKVHRITPEEVSASKPAVKQQQSAPTADKPAKAPEKSPAAEAKKAVQKKPAEKKEQSIISVKLEKLDRLLDLVSEIVITEGSVTSSPDLKKVTGNLDRFYKSSRELKKLTDELQDVVMSIRMVPVSTAFQKMNRVIRDMNSKLGKNVTLVFEGEETEVDKSIIDILGDPLMHIVRNAVDHGIELPEERAAAGKTEKPTVTLSAGYDSNEVVISCTDNGAGMDSAKIMAKAKKNGLLTKPESEYTEKEIFSFVIAAGFSTNETITEYSGRGVGMDVVKKNIEKVGGKLEVDSKFGEGSTFTIRIPLSLSIIDVLSLQVGVNSLSVPASAVIQLFSLKEDSYIKDPDGNEFIYVREKCLPLIRLEQKLEIPNAETELEKGILVHCREGGAEAVLFADGIICDQQIVVKPFSPLLSHLKLKESGMAGCSILGDGSITITLDMKEILGGGAEKNG
jgi:two-component system chemotaxis sensor kinase CheA